MQDKIKKGNSSWIYCPIAKYACEEGKPLNNAEGDICVFYESDKDTCLLREGLLKYVNEASKIF